jgi:hypothetical protein
MVAVVGVMAEEGRGTTTKSITTTTTTTTTSATSTTTSRMAGLRANSLAPPRTASRQGIQQGKPVQRLSRLGRHASDAEDGRQKVGDVVQLVAHRALPGGREERAVDEGGNAHATCGAWRGVRVACAWQERDNNGDDGRGGRVCGRRACTITPYLHSMVLEADVQ